jgi:hypothetical protein
VAEHVSFGDVEQSDVAGARQPARAACRRVIWSRGRPPSVYAETSFEVVASRAALLPLDPGAGRAEMVGLKHADVDLDVDVLLVLGQGLPRANRVLCAGDW